jgi:hypothetical protein
MPWYRTEGKILTPLSDEDFTRGMQTGLFYHPRHRAYVVLLRFTGVRKLEALRATREQFIINRERGLISFDVGPRLKKLRHTQKGKLLTEAEYEALLKQRAGSLSTPALPIPLDAPYADYLRVAVETTPSGQRVFPYSEKTAYNIVRRAFKYPHLFRLSLITNFFLAGWTIPQVRSWTGLSLAALNYYVGLVDISKMGESFVKAKPTPDALELIRTKNPALFAQIEAYLKTPGAG